MRITMTVPSTRNVDVPIHPVAYDIRIKETCRAFASLFGGFTVTRGRGGYVAKDNGLVSEDVAVVESYTNGASLHTQQRLTELRAHARECAYVWAQECIAITIDNDMEFISA